LSRRIASSYMIIKILLATDQKLCAEKSIHKCNIIKLKVSNKYLKTLEETDITGYVRQPHQIKVDTAIGVSKKMIKKVCDLQMFNYLHKESSVDKKTILEDFSSMVLMNQMNVFKYI